LRHNEEDDKDKDGGTRDRRHGMRCARKRRGTLLEPERRKKGEEGKFLDNTEKGSVTIGVMLLAKRRRALKGEEEKFKQGEYQ